jgi:hypothetical protein
LSKGGIEVMCAVVYKLRLGCLANIAEETSGHGVHTEVMDGV